MRVSSNAGSKRGGPTRYGVTFRQSGMRYCEILSMDAIRQPYVTPFANSVLRVRRCMPQASVSSIPSVAIRYNLRPNCRPICGNSSTNLVVLIDEMHTHRVQSFYNGNMLYAEHPKWPQRRDAHQGSGIGGRHRRKVREQ